MSGLVFEPEPRRPRPQPTTPQPAPSPGAQPPPSYPVQAYGQAQIPQQPPQAYQQPPQAYQQPPQAYQQPPQAYQQPALVRPGLPVAPPFQGGATMAPQRPGVASTLPPGYMRMVRRRRRAWPWVLGIGVTTVLGLGGLAVMLFPALLNSGGKDLINPDYAAPPITTDDEASSGHTLVITDTGNVSFEIPAALDDRSAELTSTIPAFPEENGARLEGAYAYATSETSLSGTMEIYMLLEASGPLLLPWDPETIHEDLAAAVEAEGGVTLGMPTEETTAAGLQVLHSSGTMGVAGGTTVLDVYTLGRGGNVLWVMVISASGMPGNADAVVDTIRIDP